MTTPVRLQRSRAKGSKLPPNTVCVTRGTKYGNPFRVRPASHQAAYYSCRTKRECFERFLEESRCLICGGTMLTDPVRGYEITLEDVRRELRGKNLGCWCRLPAAGEPDRCHAALLLALANGGAS